MDTEHCGLGWTCKLLNRVGFGGAKLDSSFDFSSQVKYLGEVSTPAYSQPSAAQQRGLNDVKEFLSAVGLIFVLFIEIFSVITESCSSTA